MANSKYKKIKYTSVSAKKSNRRKPEDIETAINLNKRISDTRVQVKMPGIVVSQIDAIFPNQERSKILTLAAIKYLKEESPVKKSIKDVYGAWGTDFADQVDKTIEEIKTWPENSIKPLN